ncbi:MAG: UDP-N-acetylbacillosamine N-acetyltransferase [Prosthecobacter sp.]|nr:UDP-N-acetylbacillosamine N-acetyltransferase [Prosthecobacter sp.]
MKTVLIGAGGHGRVLMEALLPVRFDAILDSHPGLEKVFGVPVIGGDDKLAQLAGLGFTHFVIGVGSARCCTLRARLFREALAAGLQPLTITHATAWTSPSSEIAAGCQFLPRAVVHTRARLEANVLVNTAAVVEHDCHIGAHSHIATGALICGNVMIGESCHIGAGAVIRQGLRLGSGCLVAAGAVVVKDVEDGQTVLGVPARPQND